MDRAPLAGTSSCALSTKANVEGQNLLRECVQEKLNAAASHAEARQKAGGRTVQQVRPLQWAYRGYSMIWVGETDADNDSRIRVLKCGWSTSDSNQQVDEEALGRLIKRRLSLADCTPRIEY